MDISGLNSVTNVAEMQTWLTANCVTPITPVMSGEDFGAIMRKIVLVTSGATDVATYLKSLSGYIGDGSKVLSDKLDWAPQSAPIGVATESNAGIIALATVAQALARNDDTRAMTALKTIALILDELKNVDRQIAPVGLTEISFLMKKAGQVNSITISGAANAKLKIGQAGTYPPGTQTFPFTYGAGDRVFVTYAYTDLTHASCNIILTCRDN